MTIDELKAAVRALSDVGEFSLADALAKRHDHPICVICASCDAPHQLRNRYWTGGTFVTVCDVCWEIRTGKHPYTKIGR